MSGIRWALLITTVDRYFVLISNFVSIAILSRILTPEEIGLSVIGSAIIGFVLVPRDFLSSSFLIQKRELARTDIQTAFACNVAVASTVAVAIYFSAGLIADFYGDARLRTFLEIVSLAILVESGVGHCVSLLRRDMRFGRLMGINAVTSVVYSATAITLALLGFSYISFAIAWLLSSSINAGMCVWARHESWLWRPSFGSFRELVSFGGYNGAISLLYKLYESVPSLVLGRILSPNAVGLFSRAQMVCYVPDKIILGGVAPMVLPAFSAQAREGKDLKAAYLSAVAYITAVQWPALLLLALLAYPVVDILLGPQWLEVVPLVRIIALSGLFAFTAELTFPLLASVGAMRDNFLRVLFAWPVSGLILTGAAFIGLDAVAYSMIACIALQTGVSLVFIRRHTHFGWSDLAGRLATSAKIAAASVAGPALVLLETGPEPSILAAAGAVALSFVGWLAALRLTRHPLLGEIQVIYRHLGSRLTTLGRRRALS
jgi:O-antigen/teichoic acid export membrane protein